MMMLLGALVVACGARHHYFDRPEWEQIAPGLKTIEDATDIRRRVLLAFEATERETDPARQQADSRLNAVMDKLVAAHRV